MISSQYRNDAELFQVLFGTCPHVKDDSSIREIIEKELVASFEERSERRNPQSCKEPIEQNSQKQRGFDRKRKKTQECHKAT